ncbi:hypothetical protein [uncultured Tateyamaria sp.]|uniref:hypothetical protein n=1 Tax=uncultured Tateyamaria sp. TaxID=455651 RepID=UPI00260EFC08|nr:hypothetical protein [uncultured Tateyamaria sp.]
MLERLAQAYQKLKNLYWPIVLFRLGVVVSISFILFGLILFSISSIFLGFFALVLVLYVCLFIVACFFSVLTGSANPRKPRETLGRRNRSIQFSILSIWFWTVFDGSSIFSMSIEALSGILTIFSALFFLMYLSLLASDAMYWDDGFSGEDKLEQFTKRSFYIPAIVARDLFAPLFVLVACIAVTYDITACTAIALGGALMKGGSTAVFALVPDGSIAENYIHDLGRRFYDWYSSMILEIRASTPAFSNWLNDFTPDCSRVT